MCREVPPAPVYKGARGRPPAKGGEARQVWGILLGLPSPSRIPLLFPIPSRRRREGGGGEKEGGGRRPLLVQFGPAHGGWAPLEALLSFPVWPIKAHYFPRRIPVTLRYSEKYPNHSEPFRCPNIAFQYIDLYLSTILRLLVISVISSRTPNKLRSSNHITRNTNRHRTLSVRTLRVRELCRHDRDTSPISNQ